MHRIFISSVTILLAVASSLCADDASIIAALKSKGAETTETRGTVTGVSFRDCSALTTDDYALLRQLSQLRMLMLGAGSNDASLQALGTLNDLEMFSSNGLDATDEGIRALTAHRKLKTIALFHPGKSFTGTGLAALVELPALERLTVAGSLQFADAGMAAVARLEGLKEFRTWHTGVTLAGVKNLTALKNLTSLMLGQRLSYQPPTTLADDTLPVLAELTSLEALNLGEARLSLAAMSQLKKLPKLKRLTLDGIDLSESDLAALKQQLPSVDVRWTAPSDVYLKRINALFKTAN